MTNFYWDTKNFILKEQQIRINYIEELTSKVMQKRRKITIYQKLLLFYIIVSLRPILWPWSDNSYKWVSTKLCSYIKICHIKNQTDPIGNNTAKSNNNNGKDAVFLLRTGESLDMKIDSFSKSLKPLLSRHRIVKSLKWLPWLCTKSWSETADSLHSLT